MFAHGKILAYQVKKLIKELTKVLSGKELVTLAVYELGGESNYVDTEDVAIKAQELGPGKFCWQKYPERIDLESVKKRLFEVKDDPARGYVIGSQKKGWILTVAGLKWAKEVTRKYIAGTETVSTKPVAGSAEINRYKRERKRILGAEGWHLWLNDRGSLTSRHARDIYRIDSYTTPTAAREKIERLNKLMVEDKEIAEFLELIAGAIKHESGGSGL